MAQSTPDKVAENRVRRAAGRQGYSLRRSSRRDLRARDYGHYWLIDTETGDAVTGGRWGLTLEGIAAFLDGDADEDDRAA